jgi:hypothetical protein
VTQYCDKRGTYAEPYCSQFMSCVNESFVPESCRPRTCPLHKDGCNFVSICLNTDILDQFLITDKAKTESSSSSTTAEQQQQQQQQQQTESTKKKKSSSNFEKKEESVSVDEAFDSVYGSSTTTTTSASDARAAARRAALDNWGK